jgi:alanyl-tRNA synthetase
MKPMTSAEVRQSFLDFFEEMNHKAVASSSLVPANDPTLLFTNAGMVQFKDVFLGLDKRPYTRATTSQKSMRIAGKHNDLENVGPSARHHTFFEMLGNFSFGDYFKAEACRFAFDLLTRVYGIPLDRLYFTVHEQDGEAYRIWIEQIGVPAERVYKLGDKTNFWQMADTGPCGYTAEIHFDWEPEKGNVPDVVRGELIESSGRILEIWNLVFMQFDQQPDGTRVPLPKPGVDTGMGLERIVSVLQGVRNNYQNDLFTPIIARVRQLNGATEEQYKADYVPYHVIADHVRAAAFLIADGVNPGPKDRGSVCRMVLRRAARFGRRIGFDKPFLAEVAEVVIEIMSGQYKELTERRESIRKQITQEEIRFGRTLETGLATLDGMLAKLPAGGTLSGDESFFLKSTLGLPFEVTRDVVQEKGYQVDEDGYKRAEDAHRKVSGDEVMGEIDVSKLYQQLGEDLKRRGVATVAYDPYTARPQASSVLALVRDGQLVTEAEVGDRVEVVLGATPFYVESGGQVSDTGAINGDGWLVDVEDMRKPIGGLVVHVGEVVEGKIAVGNPATAVVDATRRMDIMRNHTATHLLHAELRKVLGAHVQQKGSLVAPDRLRFDFSHDAAISGAELGAITANVGRWIMQNQPVSIKEKDLQTARNEGAMALFGEKYGDVVRTVRVGEKGDTFFSYELCGGTHVASTGVIGSFVITSEGSVAQGTRRIEALTGLGAQQYVSRQLDMLRHTAQQLGTTPDQIGARIEAIRDEAAQAKQDNARLRRQLARMEFEGLLAKVEQVGDAPVLVAQIAPTTAETMREMTDWFRDKLKSGVVVLGMADGGKPALVAAVSDDLSKRVHAGNLIKQIAPIVGGGGGGRPTLAQAGGKDATKLAEALDQARRWVVDALKK